MVGEELFLEDIVAYLEATEPHPALSNLLGLGESALGDLLTLAEPSGDPQPAQSETYEQQQDGTRIDLGRPDRSSESDVRTACRDSQQQNTRNPQVSQSGNVHQQQSCAKIEPDAPERLPPMRSIPSTSSCNGESDARMPPYDTQQQKDTAARNSTTKAKWTRNPSREKMQNELKFLRVHSKNLQQQLALLREQREQKQNLLSTATWRRVARRELEARVRAERENRRLKTQLAKQMALAQAFSIDGSYHGDSKNLRPSFVVPNVDTRRSVVIDADDIAIFESMFLELDDTRSELAVVFEENGLSAWQVGKSIVSQVQMKTCRSNVATDANSMYIELIDTNAMSFPLGLVFSTFWECCERQEIQRGYAMHHFQDESKTSAAVKTHIDIYLNGYHVSLEYLSVARAYVKDDRIRLAWRSRMKAHPHFPDVYVDETGWQVVKSVAVSGGGKLSSNGATAILMCAQMECKDVSNVHEKTGDDPLASLVVSTIEEDVLQVNAMMMGMLLQSH